MTIKKFKASYCGWLRNPAPVDGGLCIHVYPIYRVSTIVLVMQDFFHPPYDRWICILVVRRVPHSWVNPVAPIPRGPPALAFGNSGAANVNLHLGNNTLTYRSLRDKGKHRVNIDMTLYTVALWRFSNFKLSSWGISILAFELIPMKGHKRSAGGSAWSVAWKVNGKIRKFHTISFMNLR